MCICSLARTRQSFNCLSWLKSVEIAQIQKQQYLRMGKQEERKENYNNNNLANENKWNKYIKKQNKTHTENDGKKCVEEKRNNSKTFRHISGF